MGLGEGSGYSCRGQRLRKERREKEREKEDIRGLNG